MPSTHLLGSRRAAACLRTSDSPTDEAYDAEMVALAREEPKRNAMATADYRTPHGGRALA
ncbi:hypothetical protein [Streptomyces sp. BE133]|uniref:hypothetical protein n=1 Tax=Streptomyces sp. BE133 TaxID=3002523 RepID=UPI002E79E715|nr:hypothetical protein [Streptomyces sp. BE133]MEE1805544.1 hypothetical protein [Streptomyces sp. BE133]